MEFQSILGKASNQDPDDYILMPEYFLDLNIDQIFDSIKVETREYNLKPYYFELAQDVDTIRYRQEVLYDLDCLQLVHIIEDFSRNIKKAITYSECYEKFDNQLQKERCYLDYHYYYCTAIVNLSEAIKDYDFKSEGFIQFREWLNNYILTEEFQRVFHKATEVMDEIGNLAFCIEIEQQKLTIHMEKNEDNYGKQIEELLGVKQEEELEYVPSPFLSDVGISEIERKILYRFIKKKSSSFLMLADFMDNYHIEPNVVLLQFEKEIHFYISFLKFEERMKRNGFFFTRPKVGRKLSLEMEGCFDVALAMKNASSKKPVICNDAALYKNEKFLIVTGPNQGGKTTYARAIGQCIYFALLGLRVPARRLDMPFYNGILSHFATEESNKSGEGKLMEELLRLKPMLSDGQNLKKRYFIIMNELFTTAASFDSYIMGRNVIKHFIKDDCSGVYVTHIPRLAEPAEGIVSMVALLDDVDHKIRTYKMKRQAADGLGYADSIVEKYDLSYAQLKVRLSRI